MNNDLGLDGVPGHNYDLDPSVYDGMGREMYSRRIVVTVRTSEYVADRDVPKLRRRMYRVLNEHLELSEHGDGYFALSSAGEIDR